MSEKTCRLCGLSKPPEDFPRDRGRILSRCKACVREYATEWRTRPGRRERQSELRRNFNLAQFGLRRADYERLLTAQNGVCAICSGQCPTGRRLAVDHDHATGRVRALLCFVCNSRVGLVEKRLRNWRDYEASVMAYLAVYGAGNAALPRGVGVEPLRRELKVIERHPNGPGNYRLSVEQVQEIRRRYAAGGVSQRALGREFGVANTTIIRIVHGDAWRKVAA